MSATARICVVTNEADQPLREERRTTQLPRPSASPIQMGEAPVKYELAGAS
jgi:hypothetical protein